MSSRVKPFFPWVGGKRRLLDFILENVPQDIRDYHEPFLGGGAVALALMSERDDDRTYYLSDFNPLIVETWKQVRDNPSELADLVEGHYARHSREYFFAVRSWDRQGVTEFLEPVEQSARFLYIVSAGFRSMWAEDADGFCKTTFGHEVVRNPSGMRSKLESVHALLNERDVVITQQSFEQGVGSLKEGDFIYLDPPYATDGDDGSKGWDAYIKGGVRDGFQEGVRDYIDALTLAGVYALASNADTETTRFLYGGWNTISKEIVWSGGGATRKGTERLFANYLLYIALGYEQDVEVTQSDPISGHR